MLKVNTFVVMVSTLLLVAVAQGQGWEDPVIASLPDQGNVFGASTFRTAGGRVIATWLEDMDGPDTTVPHFGEMLPEPPPGWATPWTSAITERPLVQDPGVGGMTADEDSRTSCVAWEETGPGGEPGWLRVWVAWTKKVVQHPTPHMEIWLTGALLDDQGALIEGESSPLSMLYGTDKPWIDARDPVVVLDDGADGGERRIWMVWREVCEEGGRYELMVKPSWDLARIVLPYPSPEFQYTDCLGTACTFVDGVLWVGGVFYQPQEPKDFRVPFSAPFSQDMLPENWIRISSTNSVSCTELVMATRQEPGAPDRPCAHYLTWDDGGSGAPSQKVAGSWYALWVENDWENVPLIADRTDAPFKRAAIATMGESTLVCWSRRPAADYEVVAVYSPYDPLNNWDSLDIVPTHPGAEGEAMSWGRCSGRAASRNNRLCSGVNGCSRSDPRAPGSSGAAPFPFNSLHFRS